MANESKPQYKQGKAIESQITANVPVVGQENTVHDAQEYIQKNIGVLDSINYIYVVDKDKKLAGVFSLKRLFSEHPDTKIERLFAMHQLITINPSDGVDYAIHLCLKYKLSAIPVVDNNGIFLGVISPEKIISLMHQTHIEDKYRHAGIHKAHTAFDNVLEIPVLDSVRHRLLWLVIGLLGGLVAAKIIGGFEQTLEKNLILATFIPLVVYIADAVGTQLEAFTIRDFALFKKIDFHRYFIKQFSIILIIAAILGVIATILSIIIYRDFRISLVLGSAIIAASLSSIFTALLIPLLFRKLNSDPANASGPIGTIIQDILSVLVYFVIASLLL